MVPRLESGPSRSNREKILHATVQVAIRDGVMAMTLDAVAQEAGVSKGGLLYHFRSKDDLIAAMLVHFSTKVKGQLERADRRPTRILGVDSSARWSRRCSREVVRGMPGPRPASETSRFFMAIVTAAANNPRLLDPIRRNAKQMRELLLAEGPNGLRQLRPPCRHRWPGALGASGPHLAGRPALSFDPRRVAHPG